MAPHITQVIDQGVYLPRGPILGTDAVNLSYLTSYVNSLSANYFVPVGMVAFFATTYANSAPTAPAGWLKANGALISTSTYANLYAALRLQNSIQTPWTQAGDTTGYFRIPDLRGVFVRGWNDGLTNVAAGNPDTNPPSGITDISSHDNIGRAFGSYQTDAFSSHTHTATVIDGVDGKGHSHGYSLPDSTGSGTGNAYASTYKSDQNAYYRSTAIALANITVTNSNTGGTETRPYNVALLACIKY